jgi:hypothetical protein
MGESQKKALSASNKILAMDLPPDYNMIAIIRKLLTAVCVITMLQLNGCAFLLIGAGVGAVGKATEASNAKNKQIELEAKKEYGKYRLEMQQNNSEPILTYEEWLTEQVKDPEKAKQWKKLLINIEKQNNKK